MSEGPISFGKPLMFLVVVGCIGGGYYAWSHWPVTADSGKGWSVNFPHGWEFQPAPDGVNDSRIVASGPLPEEQRGVGWAFMLFHGTLAWPDMVTKNLPLPPEPSSLKEDEIDHKKALFFEYEDQQNMRYMGCAVERGDALIYYAIGCPKGIFDLNRPLLEKCVKGTRCQR